MDTVVMLSRIQFAFTVGFHFLFVPFSIGLALILAILEIRYHTTKNLLHKELADFWGELFMINYVFGVVTGLTMSIQFGTNWAVYSTFMGDVFGAPLAYEAMLAFFLESTFAGIWLFRRDRISTRLRAITASIIFIGTLLSSLWIITANGFMQHPVGFEMASDGTHVILTDFKALITNPYMFFMLAHTDITAIMAGAFFVLSVSSYKLLNDPDNKHYQISARISVVVVFITAIITPIIGANYTSYVQEVQPAKASMIIEGTGNPFVQVAFGLMVSLGTIFIIFSAVGTLMFKWFLGSRFLKKIMIILAPLSVIAILLGWFVAEVGRQPWVVYGILKTEDAVSSVPVEQVIFSLVTLFLLYAVLFTVHIKLMTYKIKKGVLSK